MTSQKSDTILLPVFRPLFFGKERTEENELARGWSSLLCCLLFQYSLTVHNKTSFVPLKNLRLKGLFGQKALRTKTHKCLNLSTGHSKMRMFGKNFLYQLQLTPTHPSFVRVCARARAHGRVCMHFSKSCPKVPTSKGKLLDELHRKTQPYRHLPTVSPWFERTHGETQPWTNQQITTAFSHYLPANKSMIKSYFVPFSFLSFCFFI